MYLSSFWSRRCKIETYFCYKTFHVSHTLKVLATKYVCMCVPATRKVLSSSNEARISILDVVFLLLLLFKQLNLHRPYKDVTVFFISRRYISHVQHGAYPRKLTDHGVECNMHVLATSKVANGTNKCIQCNLCSSLHRVAHTEKVTYFRYKRTSHVPRISWITIGSS